MVDKILANYNSLRQSNTRLSAADKARLDAHIALLAQLQSSLAAHLSCTAPATPTDDADSHDPAIEGGRGQIRPALGGPGGGGVRCAASRIGVFGWGDTSGFSDYVGTDWHHDVAHEWMNTQPQAWLAQSYQGFFEQVFLYLAAKLDQIDDGWAAACSTAPCWSGRRNRAWRRTKRTAFPVVTCGAGAPSRPGFIATIATRARPAALSPRAPAGYKTYPGLLYNQWLATVLQAWAFRLLQFELWKDGSGNLEKGYGTPYLGSDWTPSNAWTVHYKSLARPITRTPARRCRS